MKGTKLTDGSQLRLGHHKGSTPRGQGKYGERSASVVAGEKESYSYTLVVERTTVGIDDSGAASSQAERLSTGKPAWTPKKVGRLIIGVGVFITAVVCIVIQSPSTTAVVALAGVAIGWYFRAKKSS